MSYANAQLVINEISQGTGNREYVELVVVGNPTCPDVCVDIRGWIIDDNNGWYATGSGTGLAPGHIRLADDPLWACITPGTMIVLYNDGAPNPALPATDETDSNSDCVYVIPYSSPVLERNESLPSLSDASYAGPYVANGDWLHVILKKEDDTYQVIDPADLTQAYHAVSWGNNNMNTMIYMTYNAANLVYMMDNSVDDDPFNSANWSSGEVGTDETPGAPNNANNAAWINTLNVGCVLTSFADAGPDVSYCEGENTTTTLTASGGGTYEWSTSETTASIDVAPAMTTTYTVTVTSAASCTNLDEVTVFVHPLPNPMIDVAGALCGSNPAVLDAGAGFSYNWSNSEISQSISVTTPGTYTVTVTDGNTCTASTSATVNTVSPSPNFMR